MVETAITDQVLKRLNPPEGKRVELWDSYLIGFGFRCSVKGRGTFFVMFRLDGKLRRHSLGRYPLVTLETARDAARAVLTGVRHGRDPAVEQAAAAATETARKERTVALAVDDYLRLYDGYRDSTRAEVKRLFNREVVPNFGERPITDIGRRDIAAMVNAAADRGAKTTANRLYAYLQRFFRWLVERGELETTPVVNLSKPSTERSRDRVLADSEIRAAWLAADDAGAFGSLVKLAILLGQRRGELASMCGAEIDLKERLWTIPRERTKADRAHRVPLSSTAIGILTDLGAADTPGLLFPASRIRKKDDTVPRPMSGWSDLKGRLDAGMPVALPPWVLHDLRRTFASGMARLGVAPHVIERILNHTTGTVSGIAAVYNRHDYLPEMREAIDLWARHVSELVQ